MNREEYLRQCEDCDPEIAEENKRFQEMGYEDSAILRLCAAVSLQAVKDYRKGISRGKLTNEQEFDDFFASEIFQHFTKEFDVQKIKDHIKSVPKETIDHLWKNPLR